MRILVTGANGQLGWELSRRLTSLGEVIALGPDQCDPAQPARLPDIIHGLNPDVIVNAAGYTAVDKAEQEEELAYTVNAESVGVLEEEARRTGAILVHYSTDYVFDGKKSAPYVEEDTPAPSTSMAVASLRAKPPFVNCPMRTSSSAPPGFMPLAAVTSCEPFSDWRMSAGDCRSSPIRSGHRRGRAILRTPPRLSFSNRSRAGGGPIWPWPVQPDHIRSRDPACNCASHPTKWESATISFAIAAYRNSTLFAAKDHPLPAARPKNSPLACGRVRDRFAVSLQTGSKL